MRKKLIYIAGALLLFLIIGILAFPRIAKVYWRFRSANPVREGIALARELGCFSCHGYLGKSGVPDPGGEEMEVPQWSGGVWMMYVNTDEEIREFILDGVSKKRAKSQSAKLEREVAEIHMPAYRRLLKGDDLDNLIAMFKVLSGMSLPSYESPERRGYEISRSFKCFSCHGPGGSGGLPNPRSFAGFIPGWYGADFDDLVKNRAEFDEWVKDGHVERLASNPLARYFMKRQLVHMPDYEYIAKDDLDALWAYTQWLGRTGGGVSPEPESSVHE